MILENDEGKFAISNEGGKCIFPGGKRKNNETDIEAIIREVKEETGISLIEDDFVEVLELESLYKDFYDYRTKSLKPRYTKTIYYYAKCSSEINIDNMCLTDGKIKENFTIAFVDKEQLIKLLMVDHSSSINGRFFDEENKVIINNILNKIFLESNKTFIKK